MEKIKEEIYSKVKLTSVNPHITLKVVKDEINKFDNIIKKVSTEKACLMLKELSVYSLAITEYAIKYIEKLKNANKEKTSKKSSIVLP